MRILPSCHLGLLILFACAGLYAFLQPSLADTPPSSRSPPSIPLCAGLQIVTAVSQANGDYESIKTVQDTDGETVEILYAAEALVSDMLSDAFGEVKSTVVSRTLLREDLRNAGFYQQRFFEGMPALIPGSTALGTSTAVLQALKAEGSAELRISNAYSGEFGVDPETRPNIYDFQGAAELVIDRTSVTSVPVIVNGAKVNLPAIRATGDFAGDKAEFFFLDDDANPMTLKFRIGIDGVAPPNSEQIDLCETIQGAAPDIAKLLCGNMQGGDVESLQVIKITHRCAAAAKAPGQPASSAPSIEQALTATGTADVYDIYFSFDSDTLRKESAPSLKEIAGILARHPDWRLAVNGHTDSVAGDAYNLKLSARRAAAVKAALVTTYGIDPERLTTAGFGESRPKDTNETLQGRARNRRVEIVKH